MTTVSDDAVVTVLDILGSEALNDHLVNLTGRCSECGSHIKTQRHSRDCSRYAVLDVWDLHGLRPTKASWRTFRLHHDPKAQPAMWLQRVFHGKRDVEGWDLQRALGADVCTGCGDSLGTAALTRMCQAKHWAHQDVPCARCAGVIDYGSKDKSNPKRLIQARIVKPASAKELGWTVREINAVSNFQPQHWTCRP
jgi:hypothetical protein